MTVLRAYARERLAPARLTPAVLLVVVAALSGGGWSGVAATATGAAAACGLVVAFRIWDDLVDRERDRQAYPDRVLVRAVSTRIFWAAAGATGVAAATLLGLTRGMAPVTLLAAYTAVLAASYAMRGPRSAFSDRILLLKYGVFALAVMGLPAASGKRGLAAAAAAFAAACVYEWWHDAESPVFSFGGSR
jgi:4-hydroxybenzoate polyprenyltransferase